MLVFGSSLELLKYVRIPEKMGGTLLTVARFPPDDT